MILLGVSARVVWGNPYDDKLRRVYDTPRLQAAIDDGWEPPKGPTWFFC
jgi:hypothetical protein